MKGVDVERYYLCNNNGVTAIVVEETYKDIMKNEMISSWFEERSTKKSHEERNLHAIVVCLATQYLSIPTFTFTHCNRASVSPWFTGDTKILIALIKHIKEMRGVLLDGSFYVPFSNGSEIGLHGVDSMRSELNYVTTQKQFRDTFGISISKLSHEE